MRGVGPDEKISVPHFITYWYLLFFADLWVGGAVHCSGCNWQHTQHTGSAANNNGPLLPTDMWFIYVSLMYKCKSVCRLNILLSCYCSNDQLTKWKISLHAHSQSIHNIRTYTLPGWRKRCTDRWWRLKWRPQRRQERLRRRKKRGKFGNDG